MIFEDGWWRHTDELDGEIYARSEDRDDVRIGFHHRLEQNRDLAVGERTLKVYFRNMGANDQEFIDSFTDTFSARRSDIAGLLPTTAEITGNKRNMLVAKYNIDAESHEDFFDAYVMALKTAFAHLVVDNERLISVIADIHSESIEHVYGVSTRPNDG